MWRSWGVRPSVVSGEGAGEYAAACFAGRYDLGSAFALAAARETSVDAAERKAKTLTAAEPDIDVAATPEALEASGCTHRVEIGPDIFKGRDLWRVLCDRVAELYGAGLDIDWDGFDRGFERRKVALPTYPFDRQRYWIEGLGQQSPLRVAQGDDRPGAYETVWRRVPGASASPGPLGNVVVCADRSDVGDRLTQLLESAGSSVARVYASNRFEALPAGSWKIDAADAAQYQRVLARIEEEQGPASLVVFVWPVDAAGMESDADRTARSLAYLTQALVASASGSTRLAVVTRHAQAAIGGTQIEIAQAPFLGMGRVIALEHPELALRLIDIDASSPEQEARALFDELRAGDDEDQVAIRDAERYAARLVQAAPSTGSLRLSGEATYLVTGGLGALGLRVAKWLADHGAKHLVLVGRRGLPSRSSIAADEVARLERSGVDVRIEPADVADEIALQGVIARARGGAFPLRGIVHAAGVSTTRPMAALDAASLDEVCRPKIDGAWNLHRLTADIPLDFFVMFSSIASVWGSALLGHYAAANHFLDALAHYRRALGLPALAVNWGPWAEGGMATRDMQSALAAIGVRSLKPKEALEALDTFMSADRPQVTLASMDWREFKAVFSARGKRPLLNEIHDAESPAPPAVDHAGHRRQLMALSPEERAERITAWVGEEVAAVLGAPSVVPDLDQRFFDIGMDSIMTVDLRRRLERRFGLPLPTTVAFDYPTIGRLSSLLIDELARTTSDAAAAPRGPQTGVAQSLSRVAEMSDEDVERLFAEKLLSRGN